MSEEVLEAEVDEVSGHRNTEISYLFSVIVTRRNACGVEERKEIQQE